MNKFLRLVFQVVAFLLAYVIIDVGLSLTTEFKYMIRKQNVKKIGAAILLVAIFYLLILFTKFAKYATPANVIFLACLTLSMTALSSAIHVLYSNKGECLLISISVSVLIVGLFFLIAYFIKFDVTSYYCFMLLLAQLFIVILSLALYLRDDKFKFEHKRIILDILKWLATAIFAVYFIYDVQRITGGKTAEFRLDSDEVIYLADRLFFDINVFYLLLLMSIYEEFCDRPRASFIRNSH